jgi:hypothetical protein
MGVRPKIPISLSVSLTRDISASLSTALEHQTTTHSLLLCLPLRSPASEVIDFEGEGYGLYHAPH